MDFISDILSPEAGQRRRKWLNDKGDDLYDTMQHYLGPTGVPDKLKAVAEALQYSDAGDYLEAGKASRELWNNPSVANAGRYATAGAALAIPFVGARMANEGVDVLGDALSSGADDLKQFFVDEDGAIRVWHGSPHDFDKFSMDRIGTGEGAQAYGHGLYFAENKETAEQYKRALGHKAKSIDVDGKRIDVSGSVSKMDGRQKAALMLRQVLDDGGEIWQAKMRARNALRQAESGDLTSFQKEAGWGDVQSLKEAVSYLDEWDGKDISAVPDRLYEVEIDANPEDFLDWDAPLSEQPGVLSRLGYAAMDEDAIHSEALRIMEAQPGGAWMNDPAAKARIDELQEMLDRRPPSLTGQEYYRGAEENTAAGIVSQMTNNGFVDRADTLREAGIPGIKYLDQGSRGAGDGTRNYVVFDDNLLNILSKDGAQTPQGRGRQVLDMLGEGRGADVTDDMLDMGDPVLNARLNQYLFDNYDLPMDEASRMARAGEMGFDTGTPVYHGTWENEDFQFMRPSPRGKLGPGVYVTPDTAKSNKYTGIGYGDEDFMMDNHTPRNLPLYGPRSLAGADDASMEARFAARQWRDRVGEDQWAAKAHEELSSRGYSGVSIENEAAIPSPSNIRSRFARFDPRLAHLRNLSAASIPLGVSLGITPEDEEELRAYLNQ